MSRCGSGIGTTAKDDPLLFRNHYPLPVRIMIGLFGCVLWLLPYGLLVAPGWNHFSWLLIPFGLVGVAGAVSGSYFLLSALMGEARETWLDLSCQQLVQTSQDWLYRRRVTRTPFADIMILELRQPSWATDETVLSIHPVRENGDSLPPFGAFPSREEAEKITALMGHMPEGLGGLPGGWSSAEFSALRKSMAAKSARFGAARNGHGLDDDGPGSLPPPRTLH